MKTVFFQRMGRGLREKIQLAQIGGHQSPRINQERNVRVFSGGPYYCRPLCAPILPPLPFDLSIRPPSCRGETSRDCKKISPVNQLFPSFLLVCCPPVLYGRDRKATITKPNVTKLRRRRKGEHPPLALLVYRRANIRAPYIRMYGRICRNRARVLPTICVFCRNRKDMGSGISVSGSCLIRQNRSNLLVVVVVIHCGEDFQDTCLLEVV